MKKGAKKGAKINEKSIKNEVRKMIEKRRSPNGKSCTAKTLPECLSNLLEGNLLEKKQNGLQNLQKKGYLQKKGAVRGGARRGFPIPTRLRAGCPRPGADFWDFGRRLEEADFLWIVVAGRYRRTPWESGRWRQDVWKHEVGRIWQELADADVQNHAKIGLKWMPNSMTNRSRWRLGRFGQSLGGQ